MTKDTQPTARLPGRYRKRRPTLILVGAVLLVAAAVLALPGVATWQIKTQLEELGARSVEVRDLVINPATGEITVKGFRSVGPDGEDISVGRAHLRISLSAMTRRQITIQELSVVDADIDLRLDERGRWSVGGFPMDFASDDRAPEDSDAPWQLKANNIAVDNSRMTLALSGTTREARVEKLRLNTLSTLRPAEPATIDLFIRAGGGTIAIDGDVYPFAKEPRASLATTIEAFDVKTLDPLLKDGRFRKFTGTAASSGKIDVGVKQNGDLTLSYDGTAQLTDTQAATSLLTVGAQKLAWNGRSLVIFPETGERAAPLPDVQLKGGITFDGFRYRNSVTGLMLEGKNASIAFTEDGLKVVTPRKSGSPTKIGGKAEFQLAGGTLTQPNAGMTIAPQKLRIASAFDFELPPGTSAFGGQFTSTVSIDGFSGTSRSAGKQPVTAEDFRLSYGKAKLAISDKGNISTSGVLTLKLSGLKMAPDDVVAVSIGTIESDGQNLAFEQTPDGGIGLKSDGALSIREISTNDPADSWKSVQSRLDWQGTVDIASNPDGTNAWSTEGKMTNKDISVDLAEGGLTLKIALGEWTGKAAGTGKPQDVSSSGDSELSEIELTVAGKTPYKARLGRVDANGIEVNGAGRKFKSIRLQNLDAGGTSQNSPLPAIKMPNLFLSSVTVSGDERIEIDEVRSTGLDIRLSRNANGEIATPVLSADQNSGAQAKPAAPADSGTKSGPPATIRIGKASVTEAKIEFNDATAEPPFGIETSRLQLTLENFDTAKPDSNADFDLLLGLGQFGRVQVTGDMKPRFDDITANAGIDFKNIELFKFNSYIEPAIQHRVQQGRAQGNVDLKIERDKLNAQTRLIVSRLKVKPVPSPNGNGGPPIETALDLLENDKGDVKLSVPVTGSIDDPKFDLSDAIGQAIAGAMQKTVLAAVQIAFPLGAVVAIVDAAGNPTIRIKPISFPAGSDEITPDIAARVAEAASYLQKKPKENPSICGPATAADIKVLAKSNPKAGKTEALALATSRINAVRNQLVSAHSIPPNRLFVCEPEFSGQPDRQPMVDIDLKG